MFYEGMIWVLLLRRGVGNVGTLGAYAPVNMSWIDRFFYASGEKSSLGDRGGGMHVVQSLCKLYKQYISC